MDELDRQAYDLGWDYATFRSNVPDDASKSFCDGYKMIVTRSGEIS